MAVSFNELFGLGSHSEDANLEGWYLLDDDAASTTVVDRSSNANDGNAAANTSTKSVTGPSSWLTKALDFNGSSDLIEIPDQEYLDFGTSTEFTLLGRVSVEGAGTQSLFDKANSNVGGGFGFNVHYNSGTNATRSYIFAGVYDIVDGSTDLSTAGWKSVAAVFRRDGSANVADNIDIYVDGVDESATEFADTGATAANISNSQLLRLGARKVSNVDQAYLDGSMADFSVWSRALTSAEISQFGNGVTTGGPELNYVSGVSFSDAGVFDVGTWSLPSPFASGSNGTATYSVIAVNAAGTVLDTASAATGTLDLSANAGNTCYLLVRVSNTGGYDKGDFATRTSGYGSADDGYYEIASVTAAGGGGGSAVPIIMQLMAA